MVFLEIKIEHVAIAECKRQPPVAVHPDARQIQILDQGSRMQGRLRHAREAIQRPGDPLGAMPLALQKWLLIRPCRRSPDDLLCDQQAPLSYDFASQF